MKPLLLIDFGSTYTKLTAADAETGAHYASAQSYTTVEKDISIGLGKALDELAARTGIRDFCDTLACSSAAGGLRMIACGLVPSLTAEAAKRAALGAGAKVIRTFAYEMTEEDRLEIERLKPDIALLCGGTDGGNSACAIHNAKVLSEVQADFPVVVACNRSAQSECARILSGANRETCVCENVMPAFGKLNILPAQKVIRELFLRRIVSAKGLSRAQSLLSEIVMPTPAAVMEALQLLSSFTGELMAADLGGATTDIYSITDGLPTRAGTVLRGLPEPYSKRTVEGDIGMRYSACGVLEAAGIERIASVSGESSESVSQWIQAIREAPGILASSAREQNIDFALASLAIEIGLIRHSGTIETVYTPMGVAYQQTGKDLTRVNRLILTGGALVHMNRAEEIARLAMRSTACPESLMPRDASIVLDKNYILSAAGLMAKKYPTAAKLLLEKEFN